uniref:Uncharacterized protein n=1 Tax=Rhizophora mucronata TaxID=61149 RepID=A0A2P2QYB8_RHIMU
MSFAKSNHCDCLARTFSAASLFHFLSLLASILWRLSSSPFLVHPGSILLGGFTHGWGLTTCG